MRTPPLAINDKTRREGNKWSWSRRWWNCGALVMGSKMHQGEMDGTHLSGLSKVTIWTGFRPYITFQKEIDQHDGVKTQRFFLARGFFGDWWELGLFSKHHVRVVCSVKKLHASLASGKPFSKREKKPTRCRSRSGRHLRDRFVSMALMGEHPALMGVM